MTQTGPLRGRVPRDHRRTLDAVFWIALTGAPWRDLPEELGNWNAVHRSPLDGEGYDSDVIRDRVRAKGGQPEIPTKKNRRVQHSVNQML